MLKIRLSMTVGELADYWLEHYSKPHKSTWTEDEGRIRLYIKPMIGSVLIDELTRSDVARLHAEIGKHAKYQANRTRENLHTMFRMAEIWGFLDDNYPNPARRIKDFREKERLRYLTNDELERLFKAIALEVDPFVRTAIYLLIFTGLRKGEVLRLRWEHVDLVRKTVKVMDTKNGQTVIQPLNDESVRALSVAPRIENNPYVICGIKPGCRRYDLKRPWKRIQREAGLSDVHIHDIRRTVGSWMASNGIAIQVIQKVLNHKDLKTTLVYARVADTAKEEALRHYGSHIGRLSAG